MANEVRIGVVGVGHFGRNHARIYARMPEGATLVGRLRSRRRAARGDVRPVRLPRRRRPHRGRGRRRGLRRRADGAPRARSPATSSSAAFRCWSRSRSPIRSRRRVASSRRRARTTLRRGRPRGALQSGRRGGEQSRHRAAVHRVPPAQPVFLPRHRRRRRARSHDPRSRRDPALRGVARGTGRCRGRRHPEQARGHRERAPDVRERRGRQRHRQARRGPDDAQDPRLLARQLHLSRLRTGARV